MNRPNRNALIGIFFVLLLGLGFAFAGSDGTLYSNGYFHPFAVGVLIAFALQWLAFAPAYLKQTEKYFDLMGSVGYLATIYTTAYLAPPIDSRSTLLIALVSIWAIRLGSFLFQRIHKAGKDGRFDKLKPSLPRFLGAWTLQGLWIVFTLAAALAAIVSEKRVAFDAYAVVGLAIWLAGFGIEAVADRQKSQFVANPKNKGRFIGTGLWARSRHPNYFGEIVLWIGVAIIALPTLQGWQWLTLSSPFFVLLLLTRISGIPLLEKRADKKWGGQEDYEAYKRDVPVLLPKL